MLATLVDRLLPRLLFQAPARWIGRIHQDGWECWEGAVERLTGSRYAPSPRWSRRRTTSTCPL